MFDNNNNDEDDDDDTINLISLLNKKTTHDDAETTNKKYPRGSRNFLKKLLPQSLKKYWRTVIMAFFLFAAGIILLIVGIYIICLPNSNENGPHSYVFILCGLMCIVPGGYHVVYICLAFNGKGDYKLEQLPTFGDD